MEGAAALQVVPQAGLSCEVYRAVVTPFTPQKVTWRDMILTSTVQNVYDVPGSTSVQNVYVFVFI